MKRLFSCCSWIRVSFFWNEWVMLQLMYWLNFSTQIAKSNSINNVCRCKKNKRNYHFYHGNTKAPLNAVLPVISPSAAIASGLALKFVSLSPSSSVNCISAVLSQLHSGPLSPDLSVLMRTKSPHYVGKQCRQFWLIHYFSPWYLKYYLCALCVRVLG